MVLARMWATSHCYCRCALVWGGGRSAARRPDSHSYCSSAWGGGGEGGRGRARGRGPGWLASLGSPRSRTPLSWARVAGIFDCVLLPLDIGGGSREPPLFPAAEVPAVGEVGRVRPALVGVSVYRPGGETGEGAGRRGSVHRGSRGCEDRLRGAARVQAGGRRRGDWWGGDCHDHVVGFWPL